MRAIKFFLASSCLVTSMTANAGVTVFGDIDCGTWVKGGQSYMHQTWLLGYLTGINEGWTALNRDEPDPLRLLKSGNQAFLWMDNYCKTNPLTSVRSGAFGLINELISQSRKEKK